MVNTVIIESQNPRAWVAKITGVGGKFGLQREFIDRMPRHKLKEGVVGFVVEARGGEDEAVWFEFGNMDAVEFSDQYSSVSEWCFTPPAERGFFYMETAEEAYARYQPEFTKQYVANDIQNPTQTEQEADGEDVWWLNDDRVPEEIPW